MKSSDLSKLRKNLEKELDAKRYEHTLGVAYTATALAMRYKADIDKALIAGMLHDCAKCISDEKKIAICKKKKIKISDTEYEKPSLLHAKVGSYIAEKDYGINDQDILNAIKYHTTGRPNMSLLEKIIYIADFIEPNRKPVPHLEEIREMAFIDLDKAFLLSIEGTLNYLKSIDSPIDSATQETYQYYRNI